MATARTNTDAKAPKPSVGNRGASLSKSSLANSKMKSVNKAKEDETNNSASQHDTTKISTKSTSATKTMETKSKGTANKSAAKSNVKKDNSKEDKENTKVSSKKSASKADKKKSDSKSSASTAKENKKSTNSSNKTENKSDDKVSKSSSKKSDSKSDKKAKASKTDKKSEAKKESVKLKSTSKTKKAEKSSTKTKSDSGAAKSLADLYEDGLKDIYWAEKALKKALPKMHKNASSSKLKDALSSHLDQTVDHISRLEKCFKELGKKATAEKCDAMAGLLEEAEGLMQDAEEGSVRDVAIIAAAQKVEHYEIATYGTLAAYAKVLGHSQALKHLLYILEEEKSCDDLLSKIADTALNTKAK